MAKNSEIPPDLEWTDDMVELSGFGGDYEAACRRMTVAAAKALRALPGEPREIPHTHPDFKIVEAAVLAEEKSCTGAMFGAAISHGAYIWHKGWEAYVLESRRREVLRGSR